MNGPRGEIDRALAGGAIVITNSVVGALLAVAAAGPIRPVHTYSIVARDPATGELGVAVQSHYFSVGPIVPWAESGVGAVATQSLVLVDYGPGGLDLMRQGATAREALDSLLRADSNPAVRQVAIVDARGGVAVHTGAKCIPEAGHHAGEGYSVQANLMAKPTVWPAMAKAYENASGNLAERMMQALEAAEREGGDIRGRQSAAMVVVRAKPSGKPWADRTVDLRVEDHPEPLKELRRLLQLKRAYLAADSGDVALAAGHAEEARAAYAMAAALAPGVVELQFWAALSMYTGGSETEGRALFRKVFAKEKRWVPLVRRLATVGLFPDDEAKIRDVLAQAPGGER